MDGDGTRVDGRTLRFQHRKPELIEAATEYVLEHGINGLSLRPMAKALGVTHSTLLRHFSSKDELIYTVIDQFRADIASAFWNSSADLTEIDPAAVLLGTWEQLSQPRIMREFVVFLELVSLRAHGTPMSDGLVASMLEDWLAFIEQMLVGAGVPPEQGRIRATLALAQVRGLQIDLLLSGDRERLDEAFKVAILLHVSPPPAG